MHLSAPLHLSGRPFGLQPVIWSKICLYSRYPPHATHTLLVIHSSSICSTFANQFKTYRSALSPTLCFTSSFLSLWILVTQHIIRSHFYPITYFFSIARIFVWLLQNFHREYGIYCRGMYIHLFELYFFKREASVFYFFHKTLQFFYSNVGELVKFTLISVLFSPYIHSS